MKLRSQANPNSREETKDGAAMTAVLESEQKHAFVNNLKIHHHSQNHKARYVRQHARDQPQPSLHEPSSRIVVNAIVLVHESIIEAEVCTVSCICAVASQFVEAGLVP